MSPACGAQLLRFTKMHGAGNDYIFVDADRYPVGDPCAVSRRLSAYHYGVGSDGLVLITRCEDAAVADFAMRIFNADGSEAQMCGNASRCVAKYVYERGLTDKTTLRLLTGAGVKVLQLTVVAGVVESVAVDMGVPVFSDAALFAAADYAAAGSEITVDAATYSGTFVSMGNPHFVIPVSAVDAIPLSTVGPALERHPFFPEKANIEFVETLADGTLRMRVWERGSGATLACGTGACATAVADILRHGEAERPRTVAMPGGVLTIEWSSAAQHVVMTGPAAVAFDGEVYI